MIENFVPQPYPLECSSDGEAWYLVVGWQKLGDGRLAPVLATEDNGLAVNNDPGTLRYRLAGSRVVRGALEPEHERMPEKRTKDKPAERA